MRPRVTLIGAGPGDPFVFGRSGEEDQKQRVATLGTLSGEGFAGPAPIVVGDVVRFARVAVAAPRAKAA